MMRAGAGSDYSVAGASSRHPIACDKKSGLKTYPETFLLPLDACACFDTFQCTRNVLVYATATRVKVFRVVCTASLFAASVSKQRNS